jgi:hypothetical protein
MYAQLPSLSYGRKRIVEILQTKKKPRRLSQAPRKEKPGVEINSGV